MGLVPSATRSEQKIKLSTDHAAEEPPCDQRCLRQSYDRKTRTVYQLTNTVFLLTQLLKPRPLYGDMQAITYMQLGLRAVHASVSLQNNGKGLSASA